MPWLLASTVPLAYLTKSIKIPFIYLTFGLYATLYYNLVEKPDGCAFCRPTMKDLRVPDNEEPSITIGELHRRRT